MKRTYSVCTVPLTKYVIGESNSIIDFIDFINFISYFIKNKNESDIGVVDKIIHIQYLQVIFIGPF